MSKKRDTHTYELKNRGETVYIGTTKNLERRLQQHQNDGKQFTSANKTSPLMTGKGAKEREEQKLSNYRHNHGKNPKYNKDSDG